MADPAVPGASEYGIRLTRVFHASRERVWREWTEPESFADWFGGRECEVPLASVSMDVRRGGQWRLTMFAPPDRRQIDWRGEYREVDAPGRLVFTVSDQPGSDDFELVSVVLTDLGEDRTEMLFEQRGSMSPEEYERATDGWGGFFDRMQERLGVA
ncbi:MAG: SRPBCC domain-containing protein [Solirubrobacterales bacterium]|nr:SRPBCC domain-containing protein [Solirubrobacterales bacterium]MBV9366065.1 SRPBCC domain-containing protein [Solirubrobacterales bacterium]MBV9808561.1 SRPBCC domain-containing protein [Solirubrobacterales bacterium]